MGGLEPSVVVVEDDDELRGLLVLGLRAEGFAVSGLVTGHDLLQRIQRGHPDLIVLDVGLPDADGRDVCLAVRAAGCATPVLFLTARDALEDRVTGLDAGGDDYMTKPFEMAELAARARALLRRAAGGGAAPPEAMVLDPGRHAVVVGDSVCVLTPTEFRVLALLVGRAGEAVRRGDLVRAGWPYGGLVSDNALDALIARLRRKLRGMPGAAPVVTVHGVGYRVGD